MPPKFSSQTQSRRSSVPRSSAATTSASEVLTGKPLDWYYSIVQEALTALSPEDARVSQVSADCVCNDCLCSGLAVFVGLITLNPADKNKLPPEFLYRNDRQALEVFKSITYIDPPYKRGDAVTKFNMEPQGSKGISFKPKDFKAITWAYNLKAKYGWDLANPENPKGYLPREWNTLHSLTFKHWDAFGAEYAQLNELPLLSPQLIALELVETRTASLLMVSCSPLQGEKFESTREMRRDKAVRATPQTFQDPTGTIVRCSDKTSLTMDRTIVATTLAKYTTI
ncbi:hypothetical protein DL98DRAFT_589554 [Cadophora sp. DSE1049]|nr:hypothetical protein DL98DRAFT_589554 [Cadophora sp. DSE1049]